MPRYGIKVWSKDVLKNPDFFNEAAEAVKNGTFGYIELFAILKKRVCVIFRDLKHALFLALSSLEHPWLFMRRIPALAWTREIRNLKLPIKRNLKIPADLPTY